MVCNCCWRWWMRPTERGETLRSLLVYLGFLVVFLVGIGLSARFLIVDSVDNWVSAEDCMKTDIDLRCSSQGSCRGWYVVSAESLCGVSARMKGVEGRDYNGEYAPLRLYNVMMLKYLVDKSVSPCWVDAKCESFAPYKPREVAVNQMGMVSGSLIIGILGVLSFLVFVMVVIRSYHLWTHDQELAVKAAGNGRL